MGLVRVSGPLWGSEHSIWQIRQLLPVHGTYAPTGGACVQAHAQLGAQDILSGSNGPIDRKPRAPRRPGGIFASWNAKAPQGQITGKSHVLDPMFGAQARLPGECQADGAFPCGQSVCIARPSSAGAWLERPRLSWAGAQKCEKNNPKSASAPYTRPTTTPDDPTDAFQLVSGTNWDPKARVLRGHAPSFAMPRPGPTSKVSTL